MAKSIYIWSREKLADSEEKKIYKICKKLEPDNITPARPKIVVNGNVAYGIMNPTRTLLESGNSLLMGQLFGNHEKWDEPLQEYPDGSYALFRDNVGYGEIVTDPIASRTIWYYFDERFFIASTSQRAIVMFIGSFEFDERTIPWILSTGSLGPAFSWDKRIKRVPADSSVTLDKKQWSISAKSNSIEFKPVKRPDEQHQKHLLASLETTFQSLHLNFSDWVLPLSGGYDSRGILCLLHHMETNIQQLKTITWGLESSQHVKGSDAYVAKELANKLAVSHKYYHTDIPEEPVDKIINRFIFLGEGRVDHLSGYMDGFNIWKTLFNDEIQGIIRGDEGFGWEKVSSPLTVRIALGCGLCSDISNLKNYLKYGFPLQEMPAHLHQRKGETLSIWRDRLYHEYRLPTILSALADLKLGYVEQVTPLLSKPVLCEARQLPDHLRTDKALFRKIVNAISPKVDFATRSSTASVRDVLKQPQMMAVLKNELTSNDARQLFPAEFLDFVLKGMKGEDHTKKGASGSSSIKAAIKRMVPRFLKNALHDNISLPAIHLNVLAFRVLMVSKMNTLLNDDRQAISKSLQ